jgi:DNA processing protein
LSDPLDLLLRLNAVPFFEPANARTLLKQPDPLRLSVREAAGLVKCAEEKAQRVLETARAFDADKERRECERRGIRIVAAGEPGYPRALLDLQTDAPLLLYVRGADAPAACAAVVGTRTASPYGLRVAKRLGYELASAGVCVASGLARGIDTQAHEGALAAPGATWAFLGSGLGHVYPPENETVARRIADAGGGVASEYALTTAPNKKHFPRRNRLIAALSRTVTVVESRNLDRRGAMDTAQWALELSRELLAVPGPVDAPPSRGPLKLLKEGSAALAESAEDILAFYPPDERLAARCGAGRPAAVTAKTASLSLEYAKILQWLESDTRTADQLAQHTGLDAPRLSNILFELELQGDIISLPGQRYAKKDKVGS